MLRFVSFFLIPLILLCGIAPQSKAEGLRSINEPFIYSTFYGDPAMQVTLYYGWVTKSGNTARSVSMSASVGQLSSAGFHKSAQLSTSSLSTWVNSVNWDAGVRIWLTSSTPNSVGSFRFVDSSATYTTQGNFDVLSNNTLSADVATIYTYDSRYFPGHVQVYLSGTPYPTPTPDPTPTHYNVDLPIDYPSDVVTDVEPFPDLGLEQLSTGSFFTSVISVFWALLPPVSGILAIIMWGAVGFIKRFLKG